VGVCLSGGGCVVWSGLEFEGYYVTVLVADSEMLLIIWMR
jgi:hypothetical protein